MAVVWAKSNGNWYDTTLWAFWNESTQQIEDYGQVPQVDDVVYCNGYVVTINQSYIECKELRNGLLSYTNRFGGNFTGYATSSPIEVHADLYSEVDEFYLFTLKGSAYNTASSQIFVGNLYAPKGWLINGGDARYDITINGNISGQLYSISSGAGSKVVRIVINGNVECNYIGKSTNGASSPPIHITINGNVLLHNSLVQYGRNLDYIQNGILALVDNATLDVVQYAGYESYTITLDGVLDIKNHTQWQIFNNSNLSLKTTNGLTIKTNFDYPTENVVKEGYTYAFDEKVGTYQQPPESVVLKDYVYDNGDKVGSLENQNIVGCVTPEDVRKDVPLVGMGVVGSLVVPSVDDVREGVVFDNGSVGTLIVQGGGERLRIADFGYYTNAQSDTYIVDLTEQDKPKFAVAEERVLIEMFPDLDLENIPDKYFDDLFVKYLKYRLIVEYYRTAGINSTFTPSEPTTEIVNYQNVRNEVWLNSANIYLKAWAKKYPGSIMKQDRILL